MLPFPYEESKAEALMRDKNSCVDSQLWHACAGGMVQIPALNSRVYYFPQGHAEHAHGVVDFGTSRRIPPLILCLVTAVKFMADRETDEVFAKIQMTPIKSSDPDYGVDDELDLRSNRFDAPEKTASFAKTLTQSDANNGGGFSVPRYCAETIFPRLDYSADPPVQTVIAKDVHGESWKFRHIYRGTPRRHLLTTGWSNFVNQKKLMAGDSVVFLRAENGDLCIGIRRAKSRGVCYGPETRLGWNPLGEHSASGYSCFSVFPRVEDGKLMGANDDNFVSGGGIGGRSRVTENSVIEAATHAASGQPFEVVYYPRANTPEFCVKVGAVKAATRNQWCPGMRFKMAFETEDSSRISWFMGTISSVHVVDPIRWPNSPWRLLQVTWDEPDLLQNVKRVSPWLVELVSDMPALHLAHLSPPKKKLRNHDPDFPFEGQFKTPAVLPASPFVYRDSHFHCFSDSAPAAIQGARQAQFGLSLPDLYLNKMQMGLFHAEFHRLDHGNTPAKISTGVIVGKPTIHDNVSSLLAIGKPCQRTTTKSGNGKSPQLMLFGKPILTEHQLFSSKSENMISDGDTGNGSSDWNLNKSIKSSDGSGSAMSWKRPLEAFSCHRDHRSTELDLETGHCKVFMESEDVGRTLDLSVFGSYEELHGRLADMFGIEKSEMMSHVLYKDAAGALKHTGDEPFSDFMKTARRLTILTDSGSDNLAR